MRHSRIRFAGEGAAPSPAALAGALSRLLRLRIEALRADWERAYRVPPPADLTRDVLLRGVAHHLQERALGGLSPASQWQLGRLAPSDRPERHARRPKAQLRPGTTLVRSWHGQTHTVTVRERGFVYRGQAYRSLTTIAREITGAHWSGPRFFGLRGTEGRDAASSQRDPVDA